MKTPVKIALAAAVVAALAAGGAAHHSRQRAIERARAALADAKYPVEPLLSTIRGVWWPPADLQPAIDKRLKFELASFRQPIERAVRPEEFRALDRVLAQLEAACGAAQEKQLAALKTYRREREETVEFQALENLVARARPYGEPAKAFVKKYATSRRLPQVQTWLHRAEQAAEAKDRADLESMKVATRPEVEGKLTEMEKFVAKYPAAHDVTEVRRAAELAKKLLSATTMKVVLTGAGRFNAAREFSVKLLVDGAQQHEVAPDAEAQEATFEKEVTLSWTPGQPISVVLYDYRFRNEEVARVDLAGAWAARALDGRRELEPGDGWEPYLEGKPFITARTPDVSSEEWALLDAFFPTADF